MVKPRQIDGGHSEVEVPVLLGRIPSWGFLQKGSLKASFKGSIGRERGDPFVGVPFKGVI